DGTRASSSVSYLHPNFERENLHVLTGMHVMRVLFDEEQRATGVEYIDNAFDRSSRLHARREAILSAGATHCPTPLMLSGSAPAAHLPEGRSGGRAAPTGDGPTLRARREAVTACEPTRKMTREPTQCWESGIYTPAQEGLDLPAPMMHYGS